MKILVTGNMGYVGPVVVEFLRDARPDTDLFGFDTGYFAACLTGRETLPEARLRAQYFGDVRSFDPALLDGVDHVVHLAAISNDPISSLYEQVTFDINHRATVNIARAARAGGVRSFVFASSCSMYGYSAAGPRDEEAELNPLTPYAKSKVRAEQDLLALGDDDFRVTCLRFSTACGMSPRLRLDLVLNDFVACAVAGQPITVLSDGTPWRPLIHVRDMARAIDWAIGRAEAGVTEPALAVNVGRDDWNFQVRELAETVARHVGGIEVSINENAPEDRRSYRVDFAKYRRLAPDHQPQIDLDQAVEELRDGLQGMGFSDSGFRESILMRIRHLDRLRQRGALDEDLCWTGKAVVR